MFRKVANGGETERSTNSAGDPFDEFRNPDIARKYLKMIREIENADPDSFFDVGLVLKDHLHEAQHPWDGETERRQGERRKTGSD